MGHGSRSHLALGLIVVLCASAPGADHIGRLHHSLMELFVNFVCCDLTQGDQSQPLGGADRSTLRFCKQF
jgi:hypothetical protein